MDDLINLIGKEVSIKKISRNLCDVVQDLHPGVVGAMHITCADESEYECIEAFQKGFIQHHLPELKYSHQAAFRITNLGGRYEWGAIAIAEEHYALPKNQPGFKVMVVKINSHTGVMLENNGEQYGFLKRYGHRSTCCGALSAMMAGKEGMFLDELRSTFRLQGKDRLQILMNPNKTAPELRGLYAAVVSADLQAQQVMKDIHAHPASVPILYLVIPCVTLNRSDPDTEILCGVYTADYRSTDTKEDYTGLSDDPENYSFNIHNQRINIQNKNSTIA